MEKNPDKLDWFWLSENPNASHLLERNQEKISHQLYSHIPECGYRTAGILTHFASGGTSMPRNIAIPIEWLHLIFLKLENIFVLFLHIQLSPSPYQYVQSSCTGARLCILTSVSSLYPTTPKLLKTSLQLSCTCEFFRLGVRPTMTYSFRRLLALSSLL